MTRGRLSTILLVVLVPVLAAALVLHRADDRSRTPEHSPHATALPDLRPTSYAKAAAANYKVLSPRQSRRLLTYAGNLYTCLRKHGAAVGAPRASRTRIELALPAGAERSVVLSQGIACGDALGGPPPGASQQLRPRANALLLYLPKYCLLDPKVARGAAGY
jgi:hypothetical protein